MSAKNRTSRALPSISGTVVSLCHVPKLPSMISLDIILLLPPSNVLVDLIYDSFPLLATLRNKPSFTSAINYF